MARTRTVQRSPDLGLRIRMVKEVAPGDCCVPEIGPARWYNPETGAYDLETVVVVGNLSDGNFNDDSGARRVLFTAQVNGELCDCTVTWETIYTATG